VGISREMQLWFWENRDLPWIVINCFTVEKENVWHFSVFTQAQSELWVMSITFIAFNKMLNIYFNIVSWLAPK
jgi:hypothetical protein